MRAGQKWTLHITAHEQSLESQKLDPLANKQNYLHDNIPTKAQKETKVLISFRLFPDFSYAFVDIDKSHFPLDTQALLPLWTFLSKILVIPVLPKDRGVFRPS